jgi:3-hydroxyacyl-CoA dehydrogenase
MTAFAKTTRDADVLIVEIDNPPVNALSPGVPEAILQAIDLGERTADVSAIVVRGAGRLFVAGADITTLEDAAWGDASAAPDWHLFLQRIEDCRKPVIMAIHGSALGGGLELAMAGHYRIAAADAQVGQPEVNLGIIPGGEGTQRLPRLAGVEQALEMCVTGKPISAEDAVRIGVLDELAGPDLTASAAAFARKVASKPGHTKTRDRTDRLGDASKNARDLAAARELARKTRPHQTAPLRAVDAIEAATELPFDDGCRREREIFFECVRSEQAKALIHVFFAERTATKLPEAARAVRPTPIRTVCIVGAGTMGMGIATACANAGLDVVLTDATADALDAGMAGIRKNYETSAARGRLTPDAVGERIARIRPVSSSDFLGHPVSSDIVIEAVFEDLALKQQVFRELDAATRPDCILATNTSTLDIDEIASATTRPQAVVGLHFFSPAQVMRLVEIVRGRATSGEVLASAAGFAKQLRKLGVVVGNGPGFVGNRLMFPYMYETQFLVEEGATPEQVDAALKEFGMAMGMFAVDDMAGLDVGWRARQALGHFREPGARRPLVHDRLVEMGRLGQKRGKGWYRYDVARTPTSDPEVHELIQSLAVAAGIPQRVISDQEIVARSICALVNEGARALEAGVAARASDIDVIYVNGYGFPAWRGGPMFYADRVGLPQVVEQVNAFHRQHGERWRPAALLIDLARTGRTFREFDRSRR